MAPVDGRLWVSLVAGRGLAVKDLTGSSDPYCVARVEGQPGCEYKTQVVDKSLDPSWKEETSFDVASGKTARLEVAVWDEDLISADDFMGMVVVSVFPDLDDEELHDMWLPLQPRQGKKDKVKGEIRVKAQYTSLVGMDPATVAQYAEFGRKLRSSTFAVVSAICEHTNEKKDDVARTLVTVFDAENQVQSLLKWMINKEVQSTVGETTLFRTDSMATKSMTQLCKLVGRDYVRDTLAATIRTVAQNPRVYEVDPNKIKEGNASANMVILKRGTEQMLQAILVSMPQVPIVLRQVCATLSAEVGARFPDSQRIAVAGFFFLRFLCPAIFSPAQYDLLPPGTQSTPHLQRALILIAKVIQNLANGVEFGKKEAFMADMNAFIVEKMTTVQEFLDNLALVPRTKNTHRVTIDETALARDLKFLHRHMVSASNVADMSKSLGVDLKSTGYDARAFVAVLPEPVEFASTPAGSSRANMSRDQQKAALAERKMLASERVTHEMDSLISSLSSGPDLMSQKGSIRSDGGASEVSAIDSELSELLNDLENPPMQRKLSVSSNAQFQDKQAVAMEFEALMKSLDPAGSGTGRTFSVSSQRPPNMSTSARSQPNNADLSNMIGSLERQLGGEKPPQQRPIAQSPSVRGAVPISPRSAMPAAAPSPARAAPAPAPAPVPAAVPAPAPAAAPAAAPVPVRAVPGMQPQTNNAVPPGVQPVRAVAGVMQTAGAPARSPAAAAPAPVPAAAPARAAPMAAPPAAAPVATPPAAAPVATPPAAAPVAAPPAAAPAKPAEPQFPPVPADPNTCAICLLRVEDTVKHVSACGRRWCLEHFTCTVCSCPLMGIKFYERNGRPFCEKDFLNLYSPKCFGCGQGIVGQFVTAAGNRYHVACFVCSVCKKPFPDNKFRVRDTKLVCGPCSAMPQH